MQFEGISSFNFVFPVCFMVIEVFDLALWTNSVLLISGWCYEEKQVSLLNWSIFAIFTDFLGGQSFAFIVVASQAGQWWNKCAYNNLGWAMTIRQSAWTRETHF